MNGRERAPRLESATRSPAAPDRARRSGARGGPAAGRRQRDAVQAGSSRRPRPRQRRGQGERETPPPPPPPPPPNPQGPHGQHPPPPQTPPPPPSRRGGGPPRPR